MMTAVDLAAVRAAGAVAVAVRLGFRQIGERTLSPCPACGSKLRSSRGRDRRGPVGVRVDGMGWRCHRCHEGGDAVTLAAWAVAGSRRPHDWRPVLEALGTVGFAEPRTSAPAPEAPTIAEPPRRPPVSELRDLWASSRSVLDDDEVAAYLAGRGIDPGLVADRDLARAIPADLTLPAWACLGGSWATRGYRLLFPLRDAEGHVVSVHARAVRADVEPKGALPRGYQVAGAVLADAAGALMLSTRELPGPLWIVEGATDFLTAATAWGDAAVLPRLIVER